MNNGIMSKQGFSLKSDKEPRISLYLSEINQLKHFQSISFCFKDVLLCILVIEFIPMCLSDWLIVFIKLFENDVKDMVCVDFVQHWSGRRESKMLSRV